MGVGTKANTEEYSSFSEVWSGGTWSIVPVPDEALRASALRDVSCTAANVCIAVGSTFLGGGYGEHKTYAVRWDGSNWSMMTMPKLPEGGGANLWGVSCTSSSFCVAAGTYWSKQEKGKEQEFKTLIEKWNGSSWSIQSSPNLEGKTFNSLADVSCSSSTACTAVGGHLFERWNGTTWSIQTASFPYGEFGGLLESVSCPSSTSCVAVGELLTASWNGTEWDVQKTPGLELLKGVSCTSPTSCNDAGIKASGGVYEVVGWHWNGTEWLPNNPQASSEEYELGLEGISCTAKYTCTAVGYHNKATGGFEPVAELALAPPAVTTEAATSVTSEGVTLNGAVNPEGHETTYQFEYGTTTSYGSKVPVSPESAGSGTADVVVNKAIKGLIPDKTYHYRLVASNSEGLSEGKDMTVTTAAGVPTGATHAATGVIGRNATLHGTIDPGGAETTYQFEYGTTTSYGSKAPASPKSIGAGGEDVELSEELTGLSLDATYHFRVKATNSYGSFYGEDKTFTTPIWSVRPSPNPSTSAELYDQLQGISCVSAESCEAVGADRDPGGVYRPLAERWDGKEWSVQSVAGPGGGGRLKAVSCTSASACMAVGEAGLAERWNGSEWTVSTTSTPSGGTSPELNSVSCSSGSACTAVGTYVAAGLRVPLVERWNGSAWASESTPSLAAAFEATTTFESGLEGVSCSSATNCVAVGYFSGLKGKEEIEAGVVESWNVSSWSFTSVPDAPLVLSSISCPATGECTAVGGLTSLRLHAGSWSSKAIPQYATDVSCASTVACWAIGNLKAEGWNGESWTAETTPQPVPDPPPTGQTIVSNNAFLNSVSCTSTCIAVGYQSALYMDEEEEEFSSTYNHTLSEDRKAPILPTATTEAATNTTGSPVTLNATVNPQGHTTTYQFEYGTTTSYGSKAPASPKGIGSGSEGVKVSEAIEGLSPGTTYHFRVVATSSEGVSYGTDKTFKAESPPSVTSGPATYLIAPNAILNGTVNPNADVATYQFEYGTTTSYGSKAPASPKELAAGSEGIAVSEEIGGLVAETTYHFRLMAKNGAGTVYTEDRTFTVASTTPTYSTAFGSKGTGNGQFEHPADVAVDAKGNLWVTDYSNNRVEEFNEKGEYLTKTSGLGFPTGIAIDAKGNIWVANSGANNVKKFNEKGELLKTVGSAGEGNGQFWAPGGIAIDAKGNIWVADSENSRIQEFNEAGEFVKVVGSYGTGTGQFCEPGAVDIGPGGNVFAVDQCNNRVEEFNEKGEYIRQWGSSGSGNGQFSNPDGIDVDGKGNVWVGDFANGRVEEFNEKGEYITKFGSSGTGTGQFKSGLPFGLTSDPSGNIWIADGANNRVQKWVIPHYTPTYSTAFGSKGTGNGQFEHPADVAADAKGNLWVIDRSNNRIQKFNEKGEYASLQFGSGQLSGPSAIAIDAKGNLWVADTGHNRIAEFNEKGEFLKAVGSYGSGNGQFSEPFGIAIDAKGSIWVADTGNVRIQKFNEKGEFLKAVGSYGSGNGQFAEPWSIAVGPGGNVWVTDLGIGSSDQRVQEFNEAGEYVRQFGSYGSGNGQFTEADGIDVDAKGNVWVGDFTNGRVEEFNEKGEYITKFGSSGTGTGQFKYGLPVGLTTDPSGNIWVADGANNRVQKWVR